MADQLHIAVLTRRTFLLSAAASAAMASTIGGLLAAHPAAADDAAQSLSQRSALFNEAFAKLTAGLEPVEGAVALELPEIAENGNFVPLTITVTSPMTAEDHVKKIHLLSTANPVALVATFHLSPINAVARVQSRMRLSKTQDVIALAELSNGTLAIATAQVKVTIGGCGT